MPDTSPEADVDHLSRQLRKLHNISIDTLDGLEMRGLTSVPIANARDIINAYMAVTLRFARLYATAISDAERCENAFPTGQVVAYLAAALVIGMGLGAAITIGVLFLAS